MLLLATASALLRRAAFASASAPASLAIASSSTSLATPVLPAFAFGGTIQTRNSTKRGGGSTKNNKNSAGRRLGFKKQSGQAVLAGQIIYRQRGTSWHAGPNCGIGKDHTIFATAPGYIHYFYAEPPPVEQPVRKAASTIDMPIKQLAAATFKAKELTVKPHPSSKKKVRRYIAVSPNPLTTFPMPPGTPRERRFEKIDANMLQAQIEEIKSQQETEL